MYSATMASPWEMADHLIIIDPETNTEYKLVLSEEDLERAKTDQVFVNGLLQHAISESDRPFVSHEENHEENDVGDEVVEEDKENEHPLSNPVSKKTINSWSYEQTVALIHSVGSHLEDFSHPKKRKFVYDHIVNDLQSQGYEVNNGAMIQNKWKSLTRSYSKAKDNKNRTGHGPSRFMFFDLMDEYLGQSPKHSCSHSMNSDNSILNEHENIDESQDLKKITEKQILGSNGSSSSSSNPPPSFLKGTTGTTEGNHESKGLENSKRVSANKIKLEYVTAKKMEYLKRQQRHEERLRIEQHKVDIENRKLQLLEKLLEKKK